MILPEGHTEIKPSEIIIHMHLTRSDAAGDTTDQISEIPMAHTQN